MRIRYFGHASVAIIADSGVRVLFDPYLPGAFDGRFNYGPIPGQYDIVVISHEHLDHNHVASSFGSPCVVRGPTEVQGVRIRSFVVPHGDAGGTMNATCRLSAVEVDGLTIVHPGDLGTLLADHLVANLKGTDILFVPVGSHFTLGPEMARSLLSQLNPRVAIPIHFKTPLVNLPIRPVDDFLDRMPRVRRFPHGDLEVRIGTLPMKTQVWYLPPLSSGFDRDDQRGG